MKLIKDQVKGLARSKTYDDVLNTIALRSARRNSMEASVNSSINQMTSECRKAIENREKVEVSFDSKLVL